MVHAVSRTNVNLISVRTQPGTEYLDYLGPLGMTGMWWHITDAVYALTYRPLCRLDRILRTYIS